MSANRSRSTTPVHMLRSGGSVRPLSSYTIDQQRVLTALIAAHSDAASVPRSNGPRHSRTQARGNSGRKPNEPVSRH